MLRRMPGRPARSPGNQRQPPQCNRLASAEGRRVTETRSQTRRLAIYQHDIGCLIWRARLPPRHVRQGAAAASSVRLRAASAAMLTEALVPEDAMARRPTTAASLTMTASIIASAALAAALQAGGLSHDVNYEAAEPFEQSVPAPEDEEDDVLGGPADTHQRKRKHDAGPTRQRSATGSKGSSSSRDKDKDACRNQTGYIGVRQRKWGMFAAEIRDGDKRRWLGSFSTGREAGLAYDAAAISQKHTKAKTNFHYLDFHSIPRHGAETEAEVRWDLLPKDIAEKWPRPEGNGNANGDDLSRGRGAGRSMDQQQPSHQPSHGTDAPSHDLQDQQPPKRSRSCSYGNASAPEQQASEAARASGASYLTRHPPTAYEDDQHLVAAGAYYPYAPANIYGRHPSSENDMDDQDYAAAYQQHQYMTAPPPMGVHGGYDMGPYRDQPAGTGLLRKRSSGGVSGAGAGSSNSPRGSGLPPLASRAGAPGASRAAGAAYDGMANAGHSYHGMQYAPMHYPAPKGYRAASGRGCTGSDGGMRHDPSRAGYRVRSDGGSRQQSEAGRTSDDVIVAAGGARRARASDESLPLSSLELGHGAGGALHDVSMSMLHYADMAGVNYDPVAMMALPHPAAGRYHPGSYPLDGPHAPRSSHAGGEVLHAHHPYHPGHEYYAHAYHPHAGMVYGYAPAPHDDDGHYPGYCDGLEESALLTAKWKDMQGHLVKQQQHLPLPGHTQGHPDGEEMEPSMTQVAVSGAGRDSSGGGGGGRSAVCIELEGQAGIAAAAAVAAAKMQQGSPARGTGAHAARTTDEATPPTSE